MGQHQHKLLDSRQIGKMLLMPSSQQRGVTLIEVMVAITILVIITLLALPSFTRWIAGTKIRTQAESIQNGLRMAQREAVSRNTTVTFRFTATSPPACNSTASTSGTNWIICSGSTQLDRSIGQAGSDSTLVTSNFASVVFDGLGRTNQNGNKTINITSTQGDCQTGQSEGIRCLRIMLSPGGRVHLCDPMLSEGQIGACS